MKTTADTTDALLNIKQAAKMLNVSEISLRRWSDAGKLPCLRIGGRRERRFRPADLLAYLEKTSFPTGDAIDGRATGQVAQIELEGISIDYGNHLCALYESNPGRLKLALPFLLGGLQNNDRCFMVATPEVQSSILKELRQVRLKFPSQEDKFLHEYQYDI